MTTFQDWNGFLIKSRPVVVRRVFFCRSGAWTPPHLDEVWFALAQLIAQFFGNPRYMDPITKRGQYAKTEEEAAALREEYQKQLEELRQRSPDAVAIKMET
jgi:ABC-type Fe3+-hydroxamate transport system substrate-binding protein